MNFEVEGKVKACVCHQHGLSQWPTARLLLCALGVLVHFKILNLLHLCVWFCQYCLTVR